jgi:hypothetical protein
VVGGPPSLLSDQAAKIASPGPRLARTIETKSLRYVLLTMETRMSADMRLSIEVHIDGRCDGAVDVGCGCQLRADDPADYLDHNWRHQDSMESRPLARRPTKFPRF